MKLATGNNATLGPLLLSDSCSIRIRKIILWTLSCSFPSWLQSSNALYLNVDTDHAYLMSRLLINAHTYLVTFKKVLIQSVKMKYSKVSFVAILALSFIAVSSAQLNVEKDANVSTIRFYLWTRINPGTLSLSLMCVADKIPNGGHDHNDLII